ncbi:MAG TPA: NnrU family protein, partial [Paracoccaceae bacterium]|nr:NnrU family protein [Paracoccaceae bacterium]
MILLILGLALWWASHLVKVMAPERRAAVVARMGEGPWKGVISLVTLLAIALMVIGYRNAGVIDLWYPPLWLRHVNNSLMALAVFVFIAGFFDSPLRRSIRNPQLTGVKIWAFAHLLVNGDLASVVLFGGILAWAVVAVIGTKRRDGPREHVPEASRGGLVKHIVVAMVLYG